MGARKSHVLYELRSPKLGIPIYYPTLLEAANAMYRAGSGDYTICRVLVDPDPAKLLNRRGYVIERRDITQEVTNPW
jgi:hypothetical protein